MRPTSSCRPSAGRPGSSPSMTSPTCASRRPCRPRPWPTANSSQGTGARRCRRRPQPGRRRPGPRRVCRGPGVRGRHPRGRGPGGGHRPEDARCPAAVGNRRGLPRRRGHALSPARTSPVSSLPTPRALRDDPDLPQLVIVGGQGWGDALDLTGVPDGQVVTPGHLPWADLRGVVASARALLFPPDEGFGLPPLEALACGTPVLAADIPVLREVPGTRPSSSRRWTSRPSRQASPTSRLLRSARRPRAGTGRPASPGVRAPRRRTRHTTWQCGGPADQVRFSGAVSRTASPSSSLTSPGMHRTLPR